MFIETLENRRMLSVAHPVQKLLLYDQFNSLNTKNWSIDSGWNNGRSEMNVNDGVTVSNGIANINVNTYDPQSLGTMLTGGELDGNRSYALGQNHAFGYRYVIRARFSSPLMAGLVGGMFMYSAHPNVSHDELDYEPLSNQGVLSSDKTIDTNVFRANGTALYKPVLLPTGFSYTSWHTYEIRWTTKGIRWFVDNKLLRTESYVPKSPMIPILNFWAAHQAWDTAYSPSLQPVADMALAKTYSLQIDSVQMFSLT